MKIDKAYAQKQFTVDNLHFAVGDAMQLQFEDNHFDIVVSSHVYEHVPNANKMMSELYRAIFSGFYPAIYGF